MRAVGTSLLLSPRGSLLLWACTCATDFGHECMALHCLLVHDTHCLVPCRVRAHPPPPYVSRWRSPNPPPLLLGRTPCVSTHSEQIELLLLLSVN